MQPSGESFRENFSMPSGGGGVGGGQALSNIRGLEMASRDFQAPWLLGSASYGPVSFE